MNTPHTLTRTVKFQILTLTPWWYLPGAGGGRHVLVTEFQGMALNSLLCTDVLRPLTDFILQIPFWWTLRFNNILTAEKA